MSEHLAERILKHLQGQRQSMLELLQRLAEAESPSDNPHAVDRAFAILADAFQQAGMLVRRLPGRSTAGILLAHPAETVEESPIQLLVGHCDTVWPIGTVRQMPVKVESEKVWGPGVLDMKGGLVQMVHALRTMKEIGLQPPAPSVVLVSSDEEIGSPESTPHICGLARRAVRAFVLEPAFGPTGKLKTSRKGVSSFTVVVTGRSAHAGLNPEEGVSAILEMSHQVQRLFALNDAGRGITVNVGTIDGGLRPNVVAPEVRATVDVRARTLADAEEVAVAIRGLRPVNPRTSIRVEERFEYPPMEPLPRNQALWLLARDLGRQLGLELEEAAVGGASDGNTTSQYTATLDGLGAVGVGAHALHEQVEIAHLAERCALLVLLMLAPLPNPPLGVAT